jgi:protein-disulfide isomerase/uncharacterized membrane protein
MSRALSNLFTLVLALVGCLVAIILTVKHYQPELDILCGPTAGCTGALKSAYGHVGPIPTSLFGLGMYAALAALCLKRRRSLHALRAAESERAAAYATSGAASETAEPTADAIPAAPQPAPPASVAADAVPRAEVNRLNQIIWILALLGFGISWWLQYTAFFVIESFCPWCFTSALLITLIFALASRDYLLNRRTLTGEQKLLSGVLASIGVLMLVIALPTLLDQWHKIHRPAMTAPLPPGIPRDVIVAKDMHTKGDPKAPYLIVEFADYMCPACQRAIPVVENLLKTRPKAFRLAFRNYPLPREDHRWAHQAAEAAEAAGAQGKFWEMHDTIYAHQDRLEDPGFKPEYFVEAAGMLGLDKERVKRDLASGKYQARVQADMEAGNAGGVAMTPTFFFIGPHSIWRLAGVTELMNAINDKGHPMWK